MRFLKPTTLVAFAIFVFSCTNNSDKSTQPFNAELSKNIPPEKSISENKIFQTDSTTPQIANQKQKQTPQTVKTPNIDWDKKIIKNASINLEVKNYKSFNEQTRENIKKFGGYVAQEEQNQTDYKIENIVTIKVPVDQFDNLVSEFTKGEQKILEKKITSEDVTTEVIDTKSRMEAKKQVRLRYLDLLKQARNMEEILNVQNEINSIQEDIEAAAGRIDYLSHSAAYSTIQLSYFQILNASAKNSDELSFGTKAWQSFKNGWSWMGDVFVGIISIWPLFLLAFICWFAYKKWRPAKSQKPTA